MLLPHLLLFTSASAFVFTAYSSEDCTGPPGRDEELPPPGQKHCVEKTTDRRSFKVWFNNDGDPIDQPIQAAVELWADVRCKDPLGSNGYMPVKTVTVLPNECYHPDIGVWGSAAITLQWR